MKTFHIDCRMLVIMATIISLSTPSLTQTRDPNREAMLSLMESGRQLQQKGQLLFASNIFSYIRGHSSDTNMLAEAIYRSVACGDEAASILNLQASALHHARVLQTDTSIENDLRKIHQSEIVSYQHLGIPLRPSRYSNAFVNADTTSRNLLAGTYKHTASGESTAFELTEYEVSPEGLIGATEPNVVIKRSLSFLSDYPHSTYTHDVHLILGQAFQDLWTCSLPDMIDYSDVLTASQKSDPNQMRLEAIQFLELARENRTRLVKHRWDKYHDEGLDSLRAKQHTHTLYYVSD